MELWNPGGSLSFRTVASASFTLLTLLAINSSSLSLRSSSGGLFNDLRSDALCDLTYCWELYTSAQESLQIHDDYPSTRIRSLHAEDVAVRCIAFRTFFLCLRNMSRTCLGDLNFHSAHKGVEKQMKTHNCSVSGRVFEPAAASSESRAHLPVCSFSGSQRSSYKHCSVFGDPHVRTFDGAFQTCRLQGAWPIINNEFFTIQATSERVGTGDGTAITKVTVLIKRHDECALDRYVTYQATSTDLPSTFDDGQTSFGRSDSVTLHEVKSNRHVEIYIRYIDTTVVIRLQSRYFTVSLKMPDEVVNETMQHGTNPLQLCLRSCPNHERIDIQRFILLGSQKLLHRTTMMTADDALLQCRSHGLVDYYLHSCVFDLMTTGDLNFTQLSLHAYTDAILLLPEASSKFDNRTTLSCSSGRRIFHEDYLLRLILSLTIAMRIFL